MPLAPREPDFDRGLIPPPDHAWVLRHPSKAGDGSPHNDSPTSLEVGFNLNLNIIDDGRLDVQLMISEQERADTPKVRIRPHSGVVKRVEIVEPPHRPRTAIRRT